MNKRRLDSESRQRAQQILRDLARRFRESCPEWALAPETPASVLLEIWAELAAEYEQEVEGLEERLLKRLLDAVEIEPHGPRPARGLVRFEGDGSAGAQRVPGGTLLTYSRRAADASPCVFETVDDCWVGGGRLRRAFSLTPGEFRILPIADSALDSVAPAEPFGGENAAERFLFLGDPRLARLRRAGVALRLEWRESSPILADLRWEYRAATGWRAFDPRFEVVRDGGESHIRMSLNGPLFDLAEESLEGMTGLPLPWLRAQLDPHLACRLSLPELIVGDDEGGGRVARLFADSAGILEDLSHGEGSTQLEGWSTAGDGSVLLGFDGQGPYTVCFELARRPPGGSSELWRWNPRPPRLEWEYFDGRDWVAFKANEVDDRSADFQRSATVHFSSLPSDWTARSLFGETLRWLRARWAGGSFVSAPLVERLIPSGVEVVQGVTLHDQPIPRPPDGWEGWIDVPVFPEGAAEPFDGLVVECDNRREIWRRRRAGARDAAAGAVFRVRRSPGGGLQVRLGCDEPGAETAIPPPRAGISIERIRVGLGRGGNLPPGTLDRLQSPLSAVSRVEQVTATRGAEEVESVLPLARRLALQWRGVERAVSAEDYRALALSILPDLLRVDVYRDPERPGGILVVVLGPAVNPARCEALSRYLADRGVAGVAVRVRQGSSLPATLEVEIRSADDRSGDAPLPASPEELERWFASTLRELYGGLSGTPPPAAGPCAVIPLVELRDESIKNLLSRELRGRKEVRGLDLEVSDVSVRVEGLDSIDWCRGRPNTDVGPGDYLEVRSVRVRAAVPEDPGDGIDDAEKGSH